MTKIGLQVPPPGPILVILNRVAWLKLCCGLHKAARSQQGHRRKAQRLEMSGSGSGGRKKPCKVGLLCNMGVLKIVIP